MFDCEVLDKIFITEHWIGNIKLHTSNLYPIFVAGSLQTMQENAQLIFQIKTVRIILQMSIFSQLFVDRHF